MSIHSLIDLIFRFEISFRMICFCGALLFLALMFKTASQFSAPFTFMTHLDGLQSLTQKYNVSHKCEPCILKFSYVEKNYKKKDEINYNILDIGQHRMRLVILSTY